MKKNFFIGLVSLLVIFLVGCAAETTTEPEPSGPAAILVYNDNNVVERMYGTAAPNAVSFTATDNSGDDRKITSVRLSNAVITGTTTTIAPAAVNGINGISFADELNVNDAGSNLPTLGVANNTSPTNITLNLEVKSANTDGEALATNIVQVRITISQLDFGNAAIATGARNLAARYITGTGISVLAAGGTATANLAPLVGLLQMRALSLADDITLTVGNLSDTMIQTNVTDVTNANGDRGLDFSAIPANTPAAGAAATEPKTYTFTMTIVGRNNATGTLTLNGEILQRGSGFTATPITAIGFLSPGDDGVFTNRLVLDGTEGYNATPSGASIALYITNNIGSISATPVAAPFASGSVAYGFAPDTAVAGNTDVLRGIGGGGTVTPNSSGNAVIKPGASSLLGVETYAATIASANAAVYDRTALVGGQSDLTIYSGVQITGADIISTAIVSNQATTLVTNTGQDGLAIGNAITNVVTADNQSFGVGGGASGTAFPNTSAGFGTTGVLGYSIYQAAGEGSVSKDADGNIVVASTTGNSTLFAFVLYTDRIAGPDATTYNATITATVDGDAAAIAGSGFLIQSSDGEEAASTARAAILANAGSDGSFKAAAPFTLTSARELVVVVLAKEGVSITVEKISVQPVVPTP